eukprot:TRINITY_DN1983_c0_g1_i4.p1 TRINITY_DN1983_c0_g1~~TRINITY_DN1983_c0_g1_i4.p1  ORF type:complete len:457 (+),score=128.68 TRINITY_DN1983_c0_g1_i4:452-1822(+)
MSVTGEVYRVMEHIKRAEKVRPDGLSNLLSSSPPPSPPDKDAAQKGMDELRRQRVQQRGGNAAVTGDRAALQQQPPKEKEKEKPAEPAAKAPEEEEAKKTKVITFEKDKSQGKLYQFSKDTQLAPAPRQSALSQLLKTDTAHADVGPPVTEGTKLVELAIFFPWIKKTPLRVRVAEECSVEQVMQIVIKKYSADRLEPKLKFANSKAYLMRMVDDDGTPDEDFPALDRTRAINKFPFRSFAMCENPKADKSALEVDTDKGILHTVLNTQAKSPTSAATKPQGSKGNFFLKVLLPKDQYHILNVSPDMMIRDLLNLVAKKRKLNPDNFCFQLPTVPGAIAADRTLQSLGTEEIILSPAKTVGGKKIPEELPYTPASPTKIDDTDKDSAAEMAPTDLLMMSEFTASQYKEYEVTKINKHGTHQLRIMGIDREKIYNNMPRQANGLLGTKEAKKTRKID